VREISAGAAAGATAWTPEMVVFASRAAALNLPFVPLIALGRNGTQAVPPEAVRRGNIALGADGTVYIAPAADKTAAIAAWVARHPAPARRLRVTAPSEIRRALIAAGAARFADLAVSGLYRRFPDLSARRVIRPRQLFALAIIAAAAALALMSDPLGAATKIGFVATLFFLTVSALRFAAANAVGGRGLPSPAVDPPIPDDQLPVYTVLVPLYREAAVVRSVVAALRRIDWPSELLDIKLVLEEDDTETRAAVERHLPGPPFEAIVVPRAGPRTKPKALAFAQLFSRGEFVTVYDAEDDPHPRQLREAFARFRADPELACVQAPLLTDNPDPSWIARLFAIEYSALFDGLLPLLARLNLPLPLGGTSNHFRRSTLDAIGGWDPFNVTEDADIGLRLARGGYRVGMITLPTYEEAPVRFGAWMRQRTRWFKGWMQTCLVHTRQPIRLCSDLGLKRTLSFIAIQLGMIISAMLHPVFLGLLIAVAADPALMAPRGGGPLTSWLFIIGLANLLAGYSAMTALAGRTLPLRGLSRIEPALIGLPVYWLLMSVATYRAFFQLLFRPHYWAKTTHFGFPNGSARPYRRRRGRRGARAAESFGLSQAEGAAAEAG